MLARRTYFSVKFDFKSFAQRHTLAILLMKKKKRYKRAGEWSRWRHLANELFFKLDGHVCSVQFNQTAFGISRKSTPMLLF